MVGDGIARVYGLEKALAGELLEFPEGVFGMVLNLEQDNIGVVILGPYEHIKEGDPVRRTGTVVQVPVGDALIGRIVNPWGSPLTVKGQSKPRNVDLSKHKLLVVDRLVCISLCKQGLSPLTRLFPLAVVNGS